MRKPLVFQLECNKHIKSGTHACARCFLPGKHIQHGNVWLARPEFCYQGEARWDNPAAFQETNSHALVERGYKDASAGGGVTNVATGATAADQATLAASYG